MVQETEEEGFPLAEFLKTLEYEDGPGAVFLRRLEQKRGFVFVQWVPELLEFDVYLLELLYFARKLIPGVFFLRGRKENNFFFDQDELFNFDMTKIHLQNNSEELEKNI